MRTIALFWIALLAGTAAAPVSLGPAGPDLPLRVRYQFWRPDRYEGIRTGSPAVGERLVLVSLTARVNVDASPNPNRIWMGFFVDSPQTLAVTVRDPDSNYWMEPADANRNRAFRAAAGFNTFSWDATVVKAIGRTARDLLAVAAPVGATATSAFLPVLLWDSAARLPGAVRVTDYDFGLLPNVKTDLRFTIAAADAAAPLASGDLMDLPKNVVVPLSWTAPSRPDGVYVLRGHATFHLDGGGTSEQELRYRFVHRGTLQTQPPPPAGR